MKKNNKILIAKMSYFSLINIKRAITKKKIIINKQKTVNNGIDLSPISRFRKEHFSIYETSF